MKCLLDTLSADILEIIYKYKLDFENYERFLHFFDYIFHILIEKRRFWGFVKNEYQINVYYLFFRYKHCLLWGLGAIICKYMPLCVSKLDYFTLIYIFFQFFSVFSVFVPHFLHSQDGCLFQELLFGSWPHNILEKYRNLTRNVQT